jgi:hypothetical protein
MNRQTKDFKFRNTKDNQKAGIVNKPISYNVPKFDWDIFIKHPMAKNF